jgi:ribosomal protein S19E (S16A)
VYLHKGGGVGVGLLRKKFGDTQHRGPRVNKFVKASGAIIRHIIKQFVAIGVFEKSTDGGRKITKEGMRDCDRIAARTLAKRNKTKVSKKPKTKAGKPKSAQKPTGKTQQKPATITKGKK